VLTENLPEASKVNVPGKLLFFGGYSVIEPGNVALSFAVYDRFGRGVTASSRRSATNMLISKQFGMSETIKTWDKARRNPVTAAFYFADLYLESKGYSGKFIIRMHNSPMFGLENKSGLGSSAASTVALVKVLFSANGLEHEYSELIHKISQFSYAAYAGRADSGYDIATCSAGHSIVYRRPESGAITLPTSRSRTQIEDNLFSSVERPWAGLVVKKASIPEKYDLLFFNIEGKRTSTYSNVGAVMSWRRRHLSEYSDLIHAQNSYEERGVELLLKGDDQGLRHYTRKAREVQRELQKAMTKSSIHFDWFEPPALSNTIDAAEALDGVVAGRCPGAGGWDGLAFIIDKGTFDEANKKAIVREADNEGVSLRQIRLDLVH
jgi:ERG8-type phosphomevalonate kinase